MSTRSTTKRTAPAGRTRRAATPAQAADPLPAAAAPADDALREPGLYLNRELSQLDFNFRVLAQAQDPTVPLLERLRYLCISCTNLDEFFEIRVAGVHHMLEFGTPLPPDAIPPEIGRAHV